MWPFKKKNTDVNWSEFFENAELDSRKQELIRECQKYDVTPYIDDPSENASGSNVMRGVASEAEIERRLIAKKAMHSASKANYIALLALLVALFSLGISLFEKFS
jgi:hypothetical protein